MSKIVTLIILIHK